MFVKTVMLDEDTEYQALLVNATTEQVNSTRDSFQATNSTSSAVQVIRKISNVVQSEHVVFFFSGPVHCAEVKATYVTHYVL